MSDFYRELECNDCGGTVLFNGLASGSMGEIPSISYCRCVDRDTNEDKKISNVEYKVYPTFVPDYLKNKPYPNNH